MDLLYDESGNVSTGSRPTPQDFIPFVYYACMQLEAPFQVKIKVDKQGEYSKAAEKGKKGRRSAAPQHSQQSPEPGALQDKDAEVSESEFVDDTVTVVVLTAILDSSGHLVEIVFNRCVEIPCLLIKVIGICIPYQTHLNRLTVRWGPLTNIALYEFAKFFSQLHLTEICLDDSPVAGRNYEVLLDRPSSHLRYLSLARCKLDDVDCAKLAELLTPPNLGANNLNILLLVSNMIGNEGARALGLTLRRNRSLQCLDLAGNRISNSGAKSILRSLMEFPVTKDELFEKRNRRFAYLKLRNEVYASCIKELVQEKSQDEVRLNRRKTINRMQKKFSIVEVSSVSSTTLYQKADAMTTERIGCFYDPFSSDQMTEHDCQLYCLGNMTLSCLNLSYNNLQYQSLVSLVEVLTQQSMQAARAATGLLRVGIEGNNFPVDCNELIIIEDLLERAHVAKTKQYANKRGSDKRVSSKPSKS